MESPQNLKKRLKSIKNIKQITKSMELISAIKMRKAQQIALDSRPYSFLALDFLATISSLNQKPSGLFEISLPAGRQGKIKKVLFVLVASDKGLAGAFNSSLFKKFEQHIQRDKEKYQSEEKFFVAVGEKSANYLSKKGFNIVKKFVQVGDYTTLLQVEPLVNFIVEGYLGNHLVDLGQAKWDRVIIFSTHFRSALKQEPHVRRILPINFDHIKETIQEIIPERGKFADLIKEQKISFVTEKSKIKNYLIEPSPEKVLEKLAKHLFFMQVYHLILEANASEHSARRLAMKKASDNASDLVSVLNLQYNKSRQSMITKEITEIIAGTEALS